MKQSDVEENSTKLTWGGSRSSTMKPEAGKSLGITTRKNIWKFNVRARKMAGGSGTRGGEYLFGLLLLLVTSLFPIAHNMPKSDKGLTEEGLVKILNKKFTPWFTKLDDRLNTQEEEIQKISARLETVEKDTGKKAGKPPKAGKDSSTKTPNKRSHHGPGGLPLSSG